MTQSDPAPDAPSEPPDRLRRWSTLAFAGVAVALLLVAGLGLAVGHLQDTVVAYVRGESLWSNAQKEAVIALEDYGRTGDVSAWNDYRRALRVPLGDRRARRALQRDPPDLEAARRGFRQGGLEPDEIPGMIRLFRWLGDWEPVARSIRAWTEGDSLVAELRTEARTIRDEWREPPRDTAAVDRALTRIEALNAELTERERQFSAAIDRAGDLARTWSQAVISGLTLLLLVAAGGGTWWFYRLVRERDERFRQVAEAIEEVFWLRSVDRDELLYVSPAYEEVWRRPVEELMERPDTWLESIHPEDRAHVREAAFEGAKEGFEMEYRIVRPDGEVRWIHDAGFPVEDADGEENGRLAGVARDVTERRRLEERLRYQALHDPLTGLGNRSLLQDRVELGLARSRRHGEPLGLLMLDVDHFKRVNDRLGHAAGDRVLTEIARRLEGLTREEDTVARWGGDEFVVVLPAIEKPERVEPIRERIRAAIRSPIEIEGEPLYVDVTVGAVVHGDEDHPRTVRTRDPEEMLRFASLALHWAKEDAPGGFSLFDAAEEVEGAAHIQREGELHDALERGEIVAHYQPVVRLEERARVGVEALARWRHPEQGLLGPAEFVPLAEQLGLIGPLQEAVVRQGCRDLVACRERGDGAPGEIRFNVSGQQFRDPALAEKFEGIVREEGCRPEQVVLEVTETSMMQRPATIQALRRAGFRVSIDDFGTGYSTFTYLRDLEVDELKVDMTFVQGIVGSPSDAALVGTMLSLGDRLGLDVVAEGIETEGQLRRLRSLGCRLGQGFLFGRPVPAEELGPPGGGGDDGRA